MYLKQQSKERMTIMLLSTGKLRGGKKKNQLLFAAVLCSLSWIPLNAAWKKATELVKCYSKAECRNADICCFDAWWVCEALVQHPLITPDFCFLKISYTLLDIDLKKNITQELDAFIVCRFNLEKHILMQRKYRYPWFFLSSAVNCSCICSWASEHFPISHEEQRHKYPNIQCLEESRCHVLLCVNGSTIL